VPGSLAIVISAKGKGERQLTHTPEAEGGLQWSADGKDVVFSTLADGGSKLFAIDPKGRHQRELGQVPGRTPMLAPDGKRTAFQRNRTGQMQV